AHTPLTARGAHPYDGFPCPPPRSVRPCRTARWRATTRPMDKGPHVNFRSLTRGDGAVIGAAVLLLIASFLPYEKFQVTGIPGAASSSVSSNLWHEGYLVDLATV